jgi:hypothetical protein
MVSLGATIPTAWLLLVPFANLYWLWLYCVGVEKVTGGKTSSAVALLLLFLLGPIGMAVIQNSFKRYCKSIIKDISILNSGLAEIQDPEFLLPSFLLFSLTKRAFRYKLTRPD